MLEINYIAVIVAAIVQMIVGLVWYSPQLFGKAWMRLSGVSKEDMKKRSMGKSYSVGFIAAFVTAMVMSYFLSLAGATTFGGAANVAFWIWLGFLATTMLGSVLWEAKPTTLYLINVSYQLGPNSEDQRYFNLRCFPLVQTEVHNGVVLMIDDVTHSVILQNRIVASSKNTLLGDITMTLAHNINNPLTSVYGRIEYLLSKSEHKAYPEEVTRNLKIAQEQLVKVLGIIKDVSSFAYGKQHYPKMGHLHDILGKALSLTEHELAVQGIEVSQQLDPSIPQMLLDENGIEQAMINIIINAKDAMPEGGQLEIVSRNFSEKFAEIDFKDTGKGMTEEDKSTAFDLFFTKKDTHIGLGLTTVSRVVQEHGGNVKINTREGAGTCISLKFPVRDSLTVPRD